MGLFSIFTKEIAIDLGTANTVILYNDKVVVDEPSIIAIDRDTKELQAVGKKALMMEGKEHERIKTIRPLRDGVIADFQSTEKMLYELMILDYLVLAIPCHIICTTSQLGWQGIVT